jgi:plasmid maintenance system antidote protein VapI
MAKKTMKLSEYIEWRGLDRKEFAEHLGVNYATIWNICEGYPPSFDVALKIIDYTKNLVTIYDLAPTKKRKYRCNKKVHLAENEATSTC